MSSINTILDSFRHEFRRHKDLADKALAGLDDLGFTQRLSEYTNPAALLVKHVAGNLLSRWTDFLTSDGEKPSRDRDGEFILVPEDTRESLMAAWERGWRAVFDTLSALTDNQLDQTVTIRGESHTVFQAILRSATHTAYHVGQLLYLARVFRPTGAWLTIAPGRSSEHAKPYLRQQGG